jgi:hypothetical protein
MGTLGNSFIVIELRPTICPIGCSRGEARLNCLEVVNNREVNTLKLTPTCPMPRLLTKTSRNEG